LKSFISERFCGGSANALTLKSYLAKETLMRHPPEKLRVGLDCISVVKPKP